MSTTSKPAVTPEMVEKARALPCKCGPCIAEFAASAVQDAVRECADMVQHRCDNAGYALVKKESLCRELAAALREKYGVKP